MRSTFHQSACWILPLLALLASNPVIANTDNDHNNRLTTATLTYSDLDNKAVYEAKSSSFSASIGLSKQDKGQFEAAPSASAGASDLSDSANSVATSGVSGGEVNLTDNAKQTELTGKDAITTVAMLNRDVIINDQGEAVDSQGNPTAGTLKPIFDADKVQKELDAQTQITQAFSQVAPKALADFAEKQYAKHIIEGNFTEAEKWKDGGAYRVALHAAVGGLAGNLEGALGAGTSAAVIPEIGDAIDELNIPTELKQALVMATAAAVGSSVGGSTGAGAALSEATNNYLSDHQQALKDAEKENCKGKPSCLAKAEVKWQTISAMQDVGFATGFGGGLGLSAYELAEGMWQLVDHFPETMDAIKKLSTNPEFRQQFGDEYFADLEARAALMKQAYEDAGWNGSVTAGVEAARFTAEIAGVLAVVKGTATVAAKLPEAATKLLKATQNTLTDAKAVVAKNTTIVGENMIQRVIPYAEKTGARTLPFGTKREKWAKLTPKERWKLNDGALRKRINEGDNFKYIGRDPGRNPADKKFDLTGSELLRLKDRGIPYETVTP